MSDVRQLVAAVRDRVDPGDLLDRAELEEAVRACRVERYEDHTDGSEALDKLCDDVLAWLDVADDARSARLDALEGRLHAILDEFSDDDVAAAAARTMRRVIVGALHGLERQEPRLPPDTTGLVRCSSRTRAGADGRAVWCPHCGKGSRFYNFMFGGVGCGGCYEMVDRDQWWTTPVK
jgi:hypothetical protein